jgi:hypothetical protein
MVCFLIYNYLILLYDRQSASFHSLCWLFSTWEPPEVITGKQIVRRKIGIGWRWTSDTHIGISSWFRTGTEGRWCECDSVLPPGNGWDRYPVYFLMLSSSGRFGTYERESQLKIEWQATEVSRIWLKVILKWLKRGTDWLVASSMSTEWLWRLTKVALGTLFPRGWVEHRETFPSEPIIRGSGRYLCVRTYLNKGSIF